MSSLCVLKRCHVTTQNCLYGISYAASLANFMQRSEPKLLGAGQYILRCKDDYSVA